jgi:hypothetical protein
VPLRCQGPWEGEVLGVCLVLSLFSLLVSASLFLSLLGLSVCEIWVLRNLCVGLG